MLDLSWPELFVIAAVAVLIFGPNDIPKIMHGLGRVVRRLQYVKYAFSQQFEDFMKQQDLDDLRSGVNFEARRREIAERPEDSDMREHKESEQ